MEHNSSGSLVGCDFIGNSAEVEGGACMVLFTSSAVVDSCLFAGNQAMGWGARHGGAVSVRATSSLAMSRCTLYGNTALEGAGLCFEESSAGTVERSIIVDNYVGEGLYWDGGGGGELPLSCCDLYGNAGGDWVGLIADQYGIDGNISEEPLFCDPGTDDFSLDAASPCSPDYSPPGCGLIGARWIGCGGAGVPEPDRVACDGFDLLPPVPAPFRGRTEIRYVIPPGYPVSKVVVSIYDIAGRRVKTLASAELDAGVYGAVWDATDYRGARVASGVYFCRITWLGKSRTRRVALLN